MPEDPLVRNKHSRRARCAVKAKSSDDSCQVECSTQLTSEMWLSCCFTRPAVCGSKGVQTSQHGHTGCGHRCHRQASRCQEISSRAFGAGMLSVQLIVASFALAVPAVLTLRGWNSSSSMPLYLMLPLICTELRRELVVSACTANRDADGRTVHSAGNATQREQPEMQPECTASSRNTIFEALPLTRRLRPERSRPLSACSRTDLPPEGGPSSSVMRPARHRWDGERGAAHND